MCDMQNQKLHEDGGWVVCRANSDFQGRNKDSLETLALPSACRPKSGLFSGLYAIKRHVCDLDQRALQSRTLTQIR